MEVIRIRSKPGVQLNALLQQVRRDEAEVPRKHPLEMVGDGLKPLARAIVLMKHLGRYSSIRQGEFTVNLLDGKAATPFQIVKAANCVLRDNGLPQMGALDCRV